MSTRIAGVDADRVSAMRFENRQKPAFDLGERLRPGGFVELAAALDQRRAYPVGVVV